MNILVQKRTKERSILFAFIVIAIFMSLIVISKFFLSLDVYTIDMTNRLEGSSSSHWLGTDHLGRDVFSRLLEGASLTVGLACLCIFFSLLIGIPAGLLSGYAGGKVDGVIMRVVDGIVIFPDFILAIAIAGILGPSLINVVLAIILVKWVYYTKVIRGIVLKEKQKEYIAAAKISFSSSFKIVRSHLLPAIIPEVTVLGALDIGKIILMLSALSYIGIGAQPPVPEWGAMLNDGSDYFQTHPSLMIYPGLAIMITVLCFNVIGDRFKSIFDT